VAHPCLSRERARCHVARVDARRAALRLHEALGSVPDGPGLEVVFYAHIGIGIVTTVALLWWGLSFAWAIAAGVGSIVALCAMIFERHTIWIAAFLGTTLASAYTAGLGWLLGHHANGAYGPWLGGATGLAIGFMLAAVSYVRFARRFRRVGLAPSRGDE
jgi:hypothetical protein